MNYKYLPLTVVEKGATMTDHNSLENVRSRAEEVDHLLRNSILGSEERRLINTMYGISNTQKNSMPEMNRNDFTYVFFTRPMINLDEDNLVRDRHLAQYLNNSDKSVQRYVKMVLDTKQSLKGNESSAMLDKNSPFINIFSNTLETMSGWPDEVLESFVSEKGLRKETWGYANSDNKIYYDFDLSMTFNNVVGEPVRKIIDLWTSYMANLHTGKIMPHKEMIARREIDFMTAIYVVVVSRTNKKIKHVARTIGYPVANPKGAAYDFNRAESKAAETATINTSFKCFGAEYDDPITLLEFNKAVGAIHPEVRQLIKTGRCNLVEIPSAYRSKLNYRGTPFIDLRYNTLEFLAPDSDFKRVKKKIITE